MSDEELLKAFKKTMKEMKGFILNNNYKLIDIKAKYCVMEAKITETSLNPMGIAHGGFIFGLADTAGGMAARTTGRNIVTINSNINYLKPSKGKKLKAVAHCLKDGRTITVYEVSIYDEKETEVARVSLSYFYID